MGGNCSNQFNGHSLSFWVGVHIHLRPTRSVVKSARALPLAELSMGLVQDVAFPTGTPKEDLSGPLAA